MRVMLSITWRSSASFSNSRTSAPTMKPFSLPEMKTSPRIDLSRAPSSARSMIMASSSSGRWPSEFWLSPSRSNTAQAIPCGSTEQRQSRKPCISVMMFASLCRTLHRPRIVTGRHVMRPHLGRIEVVHGDGTRGQLFQLAQHLAFTLREHVLGAGLADPLVAMHAPHGAGPHCSIELPFGGLGLDRLGKRHFQEPGWIVRVAGNMDEARKPIAHLARRQYQLGHPLAEPIRGGLVVASEGKHDGTHEPARRRNWKVVDGTAQRLL